MYAAVRNRIGSKIATARFIETSAAGARDHGETLWYVSARRRAF
jgi:hypothetical protein